MKVIITTFGQISFLRKNCGTYVELKTSNKTIWFLYCELTNFRMMRSAFYSNTNLLIDIDTINGQLNQSIKYYHSTVLPCEQITVYLLLYDVKIYNILHPHGSFRAMQNIIILTTRMTNDGIGMRSFTRKRNVPYDVQTEMTHE